MQGDAADGDGSLSFLSNGSSFLSIDEAAMHGKLQRAWSAKARNGT
jgi:hypothetical protein